MAHKTTPELRGQACSLKALELLRHSAVGKAAESLDYPSWWLLAETQSRQTIMHPEMKTMGQTLGNAPRADAIRCLLELGAIRTSYIALTPEKFAKLKDSTGANLLTYESTEFGSAVFQEGLRRMGLLSPDMMAVLEREVQAKKNDDGPSGQ